MFLLGISVSDDKASLMVHQTWCHTFLRWFVDITGGLRNEKTKVCPKAVFWYVRVSKSFESQHSAHDRVYKGHYTWDALCAEVFIVLRSFYAQI